MEIKFSTYKGGYGPFDHGSRSVSHTWNWRNCW